MMISVTVTAEIVVPITLNTLKDIYSVTNLVPDITS